MSGFFAILQLDRARPDRAVLDAMIEPLGFWGPDDQRVEILGPAGLGHTLFRTTFEAECEKQPCTLDGEVWICGDIRVDARDDLLAKLAAKSARKLTSLSDPELILAAYETWGEECTDELLGDFSFAILDQTRRVLFCVRDHFGVNALYYARGPGFFVAGNSIPSLLQHPHVSSCLNDQAICDFLLAGHNLEIDSTSFAAIRRLPPAHTLTLNFSHSSDVMIRRYWRLQTPPTLRYRRASDYAEDFHQLLDRSISDRLRTDRAGIYMSGGLDSTLLAAATKRVFDKRGGTYDLRAYTAVFEHLIPDEERHYAQLVANHLDIPLHVHVYDRWPPFADSESLPPTPEPYIDGFRAQDVAMARDVASHSRVVFYGEGPDNLLKYEWNSYLRHLWRRGEYRQALIDIVLSFVQAPRVPFGFMGRKKLARGYVPAQPVFPNWLSEDITAELALRERWTQYYQGYPEDPANQPRATAVASMLPGLWQALFDRFRPEWSAAHLTTAHPYLDCRIVRFFLSLPVIPWCRRKSILRRAAVGYLPAQVIAREKTPLQDAPLARWLSSNRLPSCPVDVPASYERYVRGPLGTGEGSDWQKWADTLPRALRVWLTELEKSKGF